MGKTIRKNPEQEFNKQKEKLNIRFSKSGNSWNPSKSKGSKGQHSYFEGEDAY